MVGLAPALAEARPLRVFIDAGHGVTGNDGNHGAYCQLEKDHALSVALALAKALPALGAVEVKLSRQTDSGPSYAARIHDAEVWRADAIISLHSDARGMSWPWSPFEGQSLVCQRNSLEPGFAVLWNDGGPKKINQARERLGRAVIEAMVSAGFTPYDGRNYGALYRPDLTEGGWVDIRPRGQDVYFLRGSATVPTVIIETHHALDVDEVARWQDPKTVQTFAEALWAGLQTALNQDPDPGR